MSNITTENYAHWARQQSGIFPLGGLRLMEMLLTEGKFKNILDVGTDLTGLALLIHSNNVANTKVTLAVSKRGPLLKKLIHQAHILKLDTANIVLCSSAIFSEHDLPSSDSYDFVRILNFSNFASDKRKSIINKVIRRLSFPATLLIHPVDSDSLNELRKVLKSYRELTFEVNSPFLNLALVTMRSSRRGSSSTRAKSLEDVPVAAPEQSVNINECVNPASLEDI